MLQQMSSSPGAQVGEVATLVRPLEGRLYGDLSSEASSDAAEDLELPQCKIRRNYSCTKCTFYTQNPRAYLLHTRDVHFERFKIHDCPHCIYASRHQQKLTRHIRMVHEATPPVKELILPSTSEPVEHVERMEDLMEEVEENDDIQIDIEECNEESFDSSRLDDCERSMEEEIPPHLTRDRSKFFSCDKCNYVTHIKARYTKHVKYHSMPMIKCNMCDFRTPYKWNLDRHNKNHGGNGNFHCSMCNFTADIRQSLTVHEMNHHTPVDGQSGSNRRRNRVGASDMLLADETANMNALITKEEEGSGDSRSSYSASDMGLQYADREMITCNSDSNDGTSSEVTLKRDDTYKMQHQQHLPNPTSSDDMKQGKQNKRPPRPIPQLIPLNTSTPTQTKSNTGEPPAKKFKELLATNITDMSSKKFDHLPVDITLLPVNNSSLKDTVVRKKNESSFFDRLKERLLTETGEEGSLICKNCGFESKCLSEHSVHEKNCAPQGSRILANALLPTLSSTRCQNCRHRCKSSADLYIHMKNCVKNENASSEQNSDTLNQDSNETAALKEEKESERHPMENVVFVWNNINQETRKFDTPLDISINDDATLPDIKMDVGMFDLDIIDDNDGMNLSPSQALGKKVYKCPHCMFWASTASRFHVHIVGHLNKKPFECSLCKYKSNWRWDITKHIKLKSARDPYHAAAKVHMTDETGRRNYTKYNKFLAMPLANEKGENEFHYIDPNTTIDTTLDDETYNDNNKTNLTLEIHPLNLQTQGIDLKNEILDGRNNDMKKPKKTLWKCKKCNYNLKGVGAGTCWNLMAYNLVVKSSNATETDLEQDNCPVQANYMFVCSDASRDALLQHVREHSKNDMEEARSHPNTSKRPENAPDPAELAYRCGHCNQLSNWKHVIQRHCRLKHDGIIKVVTTVKPKPIPILNEIVGDTCSKCPFKSSEKSVLSAHLQQHQPSPQSIFKCYFCAYFVKDENELVQHLALHDVDDPDDYIAKARGCKYAGDNPNSTKRHKCTECPYETKSKSQYMYHEQFHRLSVDTPYKCPECNYSVSKRHLLHQHMRVHGIFSKKSEMEIELEGESSLQNYDDMRFDESMSQDEIPYVWVSAKNEFHKMYKCRYCSYVNSQKCKIPNHEKIHCVVFENSEVTIYKCLECKFTCDSKGRLTEHSKTHSEIYGRIYCLVESDVPDDEQIAKLRVVIEREKTNITDETLKQEGTINEFKETKILSFCQKCPARFFSDSELKLHDKFHDLTFGNKCNMCEFSVPSESELPSHTFVHSDEYHTKTKMLKFIHILDPAHKEPRMGPVHSATTSEVTWVVTSPNKHFLDMNNKKNCDTKQVPKQYFCKECPAKFFKCSALNYHAGLHGSDAEHKCKKCSYAVKNIGNLAKHELLHENEGKISTCDYESGEDLDYKNIPLSGTDLFQRKTEAQKRVLTDKDKLVKPNDHFPPVLQADPQFGYLMHGNPEFIYPTYLKNGRQKEKRYKCHKCPSAFEKREQYKIHLSLHGSKQRYKCELCDYSVKYYANYVQHMRKHQMNDEAQAERKKGNNGYTESEFDNQENKQEEGVDNIKLAIKTMPRRLPKTDFQQFSISDQQTLRLLQRRHSINNSGKDIGANETSPVKDRKQHMCLLCPYTNQRQDALTNHYRRHEDSEKHDTVHPKCDFCDLVVIQSHFLREHLKTHFTYQKNLTPECYVASEDVSFTITKMEDEENVSSDLKLDMQNINKVCNQDKIFVKIKSGKVTVE